MFTIVAEIIATVIGGLIVMALGAVVKCLTSIEHRLTVIETKLKLEGSK